jgi:hypothetical protein
MYAKSLGWSDGEGDEMTDWLEAERKYKMYLESPEAYGWVMSNINQNEETQTKT